MLTPAYGVSSGKQVMPLQTESELDSLVTRFARCSLSKQEWTHIAHLAVGLWHVEHYGSEEALLRLRTGIKRLNESHGTVNSATSGYHETVTRAYVQLLSAFATRFNSLPLAHRLALLLDGPLSSRELLMTFYSRRNLMSATARLGWVEPDMTPLSLEALLDGSSAN